MQSVTGRVDVNEQLHDIATVDMDFVGSDTDTGGPATGTRRSCR